METPEVSVITCFLNEEKFLQQAIDSVIAQEYENWELLLIDDGSTDSSSEIARANASRWPGKIIYHEHAGHANRGLAASRNFAIRLARGTWISLLDADDVWLPAKLSAQTTLASQFPAAAMICDASTYWQSWENSALEDAVVPVGAPEALYEPPELIWRLYPLGDGAAPCPSGMFIRRSAALQHNGFEQSFTGIYQLYEDQSFLVKMYLNEAVYVSHTASNLYRQRSGSIVQSVLAEGHYHTVRKHFLLWLRQYCVGHGLKNRLVRKAINKALLPYQRNMQSLVKYSLPARVRSLINKIANR